MATTTCGGALHCMQIIKIHARGEHNSGKMNSRSIPSHDAFYYTIDKKGLPLVIAIGIKMLHSNQELLSIVLVLAT